MSEYREHLRLAVKLQQRDEKLGLKEVVKLGDPLPECYQNILTEFEPHAPAQFIEQARQVAYCLWALESNKSLVDERGKPMQVLIEQVKKSIVSLPSISFVFFKSTLNLLQTQPEIPSNDSAIIGRRRSVRITPEQAFPAWLVAERKNRKTKEVQASQEYSELLTFYKQWSDEKAIDTQKDSNGLYHYYSKEVCPPREKNEVALFKGYIETNVPRQQLLQLFTELELHHLHPHSTKLFDDARLVMYWDTFLDEEIQTKLNQIFIKSGVKYRGFGQDSIRSVVDEQGKWKFEVSASSDQARGEGGMGSDFDVPYDPERFFKLYLWQMFKFGRNPIDPYRMSFVQVIQRSTTILDEASFQSKLEEVEKLLPLQYYKEKIPWLV